MTLASFSRQTRRPGYRALLIGSDKVLDPHQFRIIGCEDVHAPFVPEISRVVHVFAFMSR